MMFKLVLLGLMILLGTEVHGQQNTCTCAGLNACMSPFKSQMIQCKNQCQSKLTTAGATACLDQLGIALDQTTNCICNQNGGAPFTGTGGQPSSWGGLANSNNAELSGFVSCMQQCMPNFNGAFTCLQQHSCPFPGSCLSQLRTACTCLQNVYGSR